MQGAFDNKSKSCSIDVSVIISVYNEGKETVTNVYSGIVEVLEIHEKSFEIVFVDDGSSTDIFFNSYTAIRKG